MEFTNDLTPRMHEASDGHIVLVVAESSATAKDWALSVFKLARMHHGKSTKDVVAALRRHTAVLMVARPAEAEAVLRRPWPATVSIECFAVKTEPPRAQGVSGVSGHRVIVRTARATRSRQRVRLVIVAGTHWGRAKVAALWPHAVVRTASAALSVLLADIEEQLSQSRDVVVFDVPLTTPAPPGRVRAQGEKALRTLSRAAHRDIPPPHAARWALPELLASLGDLRFHLFLRRDADVPDGAASVVLIAP